MRKQNFIQGTIILVVVGMIVKILGLINRMVIARFLTTEGIGIYMMVMPTLILFISLAQLGFPIAISKLVSENNIKKSTSNKHIVMKAFKISLINTFILILLLLVSARFLSYNLLNEPRTYYPLLTLLIFIPLVSFTSILKGYLHGYKIINIASYSQLIEQIVRIISSITLVLVLLPISYEMAVCGALLSISFGEMASLIYLVYKIKNKRSFSSILSKSEIKSNTNVTKDILLISLPATGSRLIGSVAHFLEPIIFSFAMISIGISSHFVTEIYGQIAGYTISLLLIPSFFCVAVSTPLIPIISEAYVQKEEKKISHYFNLAIFLSFLTGCLFTVILTLYPSELMKFFFNTTSGTVFLTYMAPLFIVHYFQLPITSTLHAINKAHLAMINTFIGSSIKLFLLYILVSNPSINVHGLTIAIIVNSIFVTIADYIVLKKSIKIKNNYFTIINCIFLLVITYLIGNYLKLINIFNNSFINILLLCLFYVSVVFFFNIGNIRKIKNQIKLNR